MNEKTTKILTVISITVVAVFLIAALVIVIVRNNKPEGYVNPTFDEGCTAINFEEAPGNKVGVTDGFTVAVPNAISGDKNGINVCFASAPDNKGNIKLELIDDNGNIVAESGLIKPGEYLETVSKVYKKNLPKNDCEITIKVLTYEPETYVSLGSCTFKVKFVCN